jgi:gluconolactonase
MVHSFICTALFLFPLLGCAQSELPTQQVTDENTFPGAEGPVCDEAGNLFACNFQRPGVIGKISPDNKATIFAVLPAGGRPNGLQIDSRGYLIVADYLNHAVYRVDPRTGEFLECLTRNWMGAQFRQPNDVGIAADDTVYFSDPDWKSPIAGRIFKVKPGPQPETVLLDQGLNTPNGITVSADQAKLYVSQSNAHNILVYDRLPDGTVQNRRVFFDLATISGGDAALPDGMRCDSRGNLYVAMVRLGRILIFHPDGMLDAKSIRTIGKNPTNLAFCGAKRRVLYVTEGQHRRIEKIDLDRAGWK